MKHPMQPIRKAEGGIIRFQSNAIIERLWREGKLDLNAIACWKGISDDDHMQLAQLLGYSVGGYCDLRYASEESKDAADAIADLVSEGKEVLSPEERVFQLADQLAIERERFEVASALRLVTADISGACCASLVVFGDKEERLLIQGPCSGKSVVLAQMVRTSDRWFPAELDDGELKRTFFGGSDLMSAVRVFIRKHFDEINTLAQEECTALELAVEKLSAEVKASAAAKSEEDVRNETRGESGS